jgi:mannose-1-phosphate guanylyltransferase
MKALLLAGGLGTRLLPLTAIWPKCLMPINGIPLLQYWIEELERAGVEQVLVNSHYLADEVATFVARKKWNTDVQIIFEPTLLGTAGTIRKNHGFFSSDDALIIHADNWSSCILKDLIDHHEKRRPTYTKMTMLTFEAKNPERCGIVDLDDFGVVSAFYEKISNPPSRNANAAVYVMTSELIQLISQDESCFDISIDVIPKLVGKISTFKNVGFHRDIGTIDELLAAQNDIKMPAKRMDPDDEWVKYYSNHSIHQNLEKLINEH